MLFALYKQPRARPLMPAPPRRWERLQMFNLSTGARKRANDAWFMWYIHITHRLLHAASDSRPKTLPHSVYICRLFRVAGTVEIASSWDLCIHSQWRPDRMKKTSPSAQNTQHKNNISPSSAISWCGTNFYIYNIITAALPYTYIFILSSILPWLFNIYRDRKVNWNQFVL